MRRLTGLDASFLYLETPNNHMHVAASYIFDPADAPDYSFERVRSLVENRLHLLPPFRQRLVEVPFGLYHPIWIEDPDFDIDYHVRRASLRAPGDKFALAEFAANFFSRQLDRRRPLWEMYVIDGLEGGKVAMLTKTHHAAIDGASGAELTAQLLDVSPVTVVHEPPTWMPEQPPSDLEMLAYAMNALVTHPTRLIEVVRATLAGAIAARSKRAESPDRVSAPGLFSAPRTSINTALTPHRTFSFTEITLADIKTVRTAFGGTVNDTILAICAGAVRRYLADNNELPSEPLVAMVPISVRSPDQKGVMGNRVSNMLVSLATHIADPAGRLRLIQASTAAGKDKVNTIGAETFSNWAEFAAPGLAARVARLYSSNRLADRHKPMFNLTISNIPGPNIPLYSAGALMTAWYPMGPIFDGNGLNMTVMSYHGTVYVGLVGCRETVTDIWKLARYVDDAMVELLGAATAGPTDPVASSPRRAAQRSKKATAKSERVTAK